MNKETIWKAVKEPLRLLVLALIPFGIVYANNLDYSWALMAVLILRFIDKWMHEVGKAQNKEGLTKGITRF